MALVLHRGAVVICMHGGPATPTVTFPRVKLLGQDVVTVTLPYSVAGCSLASTSTPPCVSGQWVMGATRVKAGGLALAIQGGSAVCVPTGTGMQATVVQPRVNVL